MARKKRASSNLLIKYNKKKIISTVIWVLTGLGVLGFGIYYREVFEIVFGILAALYGLLNLRTRVNSTNAIARREKSKLSFLCLCIVIYSLVNPLVNLAVIYDLYKRDFVIRGGFDEKEI